MIPRRSSAFTYLDTGPAGPNAIVEMMPGIRNLMDYAGVRPGDRTLIIVEHTVNDAVIGAIAGAAAHRDADVHILSVPPFSPGGWDRENPSPIVAAAYAEADVVIACVWWAEVHCAPLFFSEIPRHRARFVSLQMTATPAALETGSRFPPEVFYAIKRAALDRCSGAAKIRVTTRAGTDVTFSDLTIDTDAGPLEPGMWRPWPLGGLNFYPGRTDGVLVVEESTVTGVPEEPLFIHVRDNLVSEIAGGIAADQIRSFAPDGYYLRHAFIGLNPKVRIAGGTQFEREKHAGAFYLGIDGLTDGRPDRSGPGYAHCDCHFDRPTVLVDDVALVENGRLLLLDDPAVRDVAGRFGPAEIILNDNPQLILPRRFTSR